ncbi:phospholipase D-like domain-containing protein [Duffyella gerundensis]|uniref:phospholipase D-like domain-containing protein n=1 Tax=Duffyella gerundensis TaxID=1619313 RepID=UPI0016546CAC|nr:phospholipase D-like domain-containing protein [Duffyella gerundensis]
MNDLTSSSSQAGFSIPGFELIYDAPIETSLQADDLRSSAVVWTEMFDQAQQQIDIAQFYVASQSGSRLDEVLRALKAAAARGVRIRFLIEEQGLKRSTADTLAELQSITGLSLRTIAFARLTGGIMHAKYLLIDGKRAFVGSQNFDWRALEHIHETGVLIDDALVVQQIAAIFNHDWEMQPLLQAGLPLPVGELTACQPAACDRDHFLVASPTAWNPAGIADAQVVLPQLLAAAKSHIHVQVMEYSPLLFGAGRRRGFYPLIDNALRAAAARGVEVALMVANWNTKQPDISWLKSLALVPNVHIRIVTLPDASSGFIPFARVIHSKIMTIDHRLAWVGTSNWSGGYLDNSRNLELVMNNATLAQRLDALWQQLWQSEYAAPLKIDYDYPAPDPAGLKSAT